jgi:hypothetical protein
MFDIPNMVMIGGNSRNSGKTTLACSIISKFSITNEVVGLKVTGIRPGEAHLHGNHSGETMHGYTILEETDCSSGKDTSKMLKAGATRVFYIFAEDIFIEKAILHFVSMYINNQVIVCESRSLRDIVKPGLFLMMVRLPASVKEKDVSVYLSKADKAIYNGDDQAEINQFVSDLYFKQGKFVIT